MTTTIRARVERVMRPPHPGDIRPWVTTAVARHDDGTLIVTIGDRLAVRAESFASHPEAIQAAHRVMADLDRELMAEVHESRSSRRAARVAQIADEAAAATRPPVIPLIHLAATA